MAGRKYFDAALFEFLRDLEKNNDRAWFKANKARYEKDLKEPIQAFIVDFGKELEAISPRFLADPRPVGGSMFRIYRDTRFSKDKTPYKTQAGIQFRHEAGKDAHAPGFYVHLEPGNVFLGGGLWHPKTEDQRAIRERIVEKRSEWRKAVGSKVFKEEMTLAGDSLKRPPRGFDADDPDIGDLKRKDFIATVPLDEALATSDRFGTEVARHFRAMSPLVKFLCAACGLKF